MPKKKWNQRDNNQVLSEEQISPTPEIYEEIIPNGSEMESIIHPQQPTIKPATETPKQKGIVISISKGFVSVNVNGFGTRIKYDATKHASLKKGDVLEF